MPDEAEGILPVKSRLNGSMGAAAGDDSAFFSFRM
jgi:hypothetical protein